ncbi:hypothetical protein GCM10007420_03480 [Glycocaulis albus]|uniref:Transferrin-binding protein B C-lobe/N-lobe beta barrel domain-containing protein n=1 Tax=Glycocaulis albus TaxID=1382801 RepID=A0ABQ1XDM4_9PROT|nr:hypothetical protein [Glycocaulis albus]GGG91494.1 hypothetical protein GCM10007420_03480 [Glycocaulis albus]
MTAISRLLTAGAGALALNGVAACEDNAGTAGWVDVEEAATTPAAEPDHAAQERVSTREQHFDAYGYYMPQGSLQFGNWRLHHIHIAPGFEFEAWEAGGRRDAMPFGPVFAVFEDVSSPMGTNELGQEYYEVSTRVRADYYRIEDGAFTFEGADPELGTVIIDGTLHGDVVRAQDTGEPAFTGGMEVGGDRVRNMSLYWYGGD